MAVAVRCQRDFFPQDSFTHHSSHSFLFVLFFLFFLVLMETLRMEWRCSGQWGGSNLPSFFILCLSALVGGFSFFLAEVFVWASLMQWSSFLGYPDG